jgi:hypothetical protein
VNGLQPESHVPTHNPPQQPATTTATIPTTKISTPTVEAIPNEKLHDEKIEALKDASSIESSDLNSLYKAARKERMEMFHVKEARAERKSLVESLQVCPMPLFLLRVVSSSHFCFFFFFFF